jgi:HEXXH motif-containing protein
MRAADAEFDRLLELLAPWIERGQLAFANELRRLVYRNAPETFERLDFDDDSAFLEPVAFALVARDAVSRDALALTYAGAVSRGRRPEAVSAVADGEGRVFLPGLGYLSGLPAGMALELHADGESPLGYSTFGGQPTTTTTTLEEWRLGDGGPALLPHQVVALTDVVHAEGGGLSGLEEAADRRRAALSHGWRRIEERWPALAEAIANVVRYVVVFDDPAKNSFALTSAHGVVFLNSSLGETESFFVEDLAHQCGHVMFAAAWEGAEPLLLVAPETTVGDVVGTDDDRPLEVALHGMVTQTLMTSALHRLLGAPDVNRHETTGRLLFAILRLGLDLRALASQPVYSDAGIPLVHELVAAYGAMAERYRDALLGANFSEQPYNFDYAAYLERNPPTGSLAHA